MTHESNESYNDDGDLTHSKISTTHLCRKQENHHHNKFPTKSPININCKNSTKKLCKSTSHIAIIGTGPSALSCALSLQQAGFENLVLYERDANFHARKDGYGLTLTYNSSPTSSNAPLAQLGLLEDLAQLDCPSRSHYVFNAQGEILGYYGNAFCDESSRTNMRGFGQRGNLRVPRQVLRKVMMDTLFQRDCTPDIALDSTKEKYETNNNRNRIRDYDSADNGLSTKDGNKRDTLKKVSIKWGKKLTSYTCLCTTNGTTPAGTTNTVEDGTSSASGDETNEIKGGNSSKPITLHFEDGSVATADFLIGADGLRSAVLRTLLATEERSDEEPALSPPTSPKKTSFPSSPSLLSTAPHGTTELSYLGIMIVLGITADFFHPLLDERGFYTLDGNHRLFTMPFEGSRICDLESYNTILPRGDSIGIGTGSANTSTTWDGIKHTRRYMWQLSFPLDFETADTLSNAGPHALLKEVLTRTRTWHAPVQDMVSSTPLETIWGTPLMDRDPAAIRKHLESSHARQRAKGGNAIEPVVALGDAIHSMSPFKGQGCNQALMDGPLLTKWLQSSKLHSAIKGFTRDMVQRTSKKVMASREAAQYLHSAQVLNDEEDFAGIPKDRVKIFLADLKKRGITANLGIELDLKVGEVIQELGFYSTRNDSEETVAMEEGSTTDEKLALKLAGSGGNTALAQIRQLSTSNPASIRYARDDDTGETCLHLAAKVGCYHTVKWLLTEACLSHNVEDIRGQSPLHAAVLGGNVRVTKLLTRMSQDDEIC